MLSLKAVMHDFCGVWFLKTNAVDSNCDSKANSSINVESHCKK